MIDFVKVELNYSIIEKLFKNPLLEFQLPVKIESAEIIDFATASYRGLKFIIKKGKYAELQGSLHKYYNYGLHNYNDFTYEQLVHVLNDIKKKFDLNLFTCILRNVEVGVNIVPHIKSRTIIRGLILHRNKMFKHVSIKNSNYIQVIHNRLIIKFYDKKLQFPKLVESDELVRFEVKFIKMIDLNNLGISTLGDLLSKHNLNTLSNILLERWDEILMYDESIECKSNLKLEYANWKNGHYWESLSKQERYRQKIKYNFEVSNHSNYNHKKLQKIIQSKVNFYLNIDTN